MTSTKPEFSGYMYLFFDIILSSLYGPGVASDSNRNEYQEYFLGGKGGRCVGRQPSHLHVPIVLKSGSLNLLEH